MSTIFGVLTLIVAVVIANIAHLFFPRLPLAFYQIFVGIFLALWPSISTFTLEPETFLLLIIAPLLFNDGQNASFRAISRNVKQIISMTVYLAIFTVLVAGIGLHFAVAAFSLPLAFMLAAIITPTDAVAVKSLTTGVAMPANVHRTLEHESLFNDASGLVLFSLAASTLASGQFSLVHGLTTFLYVFLGGIIFGALLFPKLLPPKRNTYTATEFANGLIAAVQTAIGRIEEAAAHPRERAAVIDQLSSQMTLTYQVNSATYQKILADCHEVEMQLIDELSQEGQIDQFLLDFYQHLITQSVVNHTNHGLRSFIRTFYHRWKWRRIRHKLRQVQVTTATDAVQKEIRNLLARTTWAVNNHLNQVQTSTNVNEVAMVRRLYLNRIRALSRQQRLDQEVMHQLFVSAFQDEHSFIQQALAAGDINADLAKALNEHISIDELVYMQSN